jgi:hypothetical protein
MKPSTVLLAAALSLALVVAGVEVLRWAGVGWVTLQLSLGPQIVVYRPALMQPLPVYLCLSISIWSSKQPTCSWLEQYVKASI